MKLRDLTVWIAITILGIKKKKCGAGMELDLYSRDFFFNLTILLLIFLFYSNLSNSNFI